MLTMGVTRLVAEELREAPRTVPELATRCDLTESRVEDVLESLSAQGIATREGDCWTIDESKLGAWAFVRDNGRWVLRRFARPFRLFDPR